MDYQYSFCTTGGGGQSRRQLNTVLVAMGSTEMSVLAAERIANSFGARRLFRDESREPPLRVSREW